MKKNSDQLWKAGHKEYTKATSHWHEQSNLQNALWRKPDENGCRSDQLSDAYLWPQMQKKKRQGPRAEVWTRKQLCGDWQHEAVQWERHR